MWWTSPFHKSPCSPLSCSSSQAKTESCSAPWSRFLAALVVEQLAEVLTNVFQDRIQQRTLEQISDNPSSASSGGTRGGLHSFLQGQGSAAFRGADLPNSARRHFEEQQTRYCRGCCRETGWKLVHADVFRTPRPTSTMSITCRNSSMRKRRQSTFLHSVRSSGMLLVPRRGPVDLFETNKKPNSDERCVFITDDCVDPCAVGFCEGLRAKAFQRLRANMSFVHCCLCSAVLTSFSQSGWMSPSGIKQVTQESTLKARSRVVTTVIEL